MIVVGTELLLSFCKKHANSEKAIKTWLQQVKQAAWKTPQEIKNAYRNSDFLPNNRVIFNIKGNHYRLVVKVRYLNGIVKIEWIGTHAEYSKQNF
ncbi:MULTISPECIES: type II toxin-antitoxin system HigB family toxin [Testudinibacter]|uniref:Type II toxin-antitoxin system HigB family toxin n=1 Tax=Testudinibacter aquarius TaxID=1524974 RepID=A0A4R3Y4E1_9PAST|nr:MULTISPECIES: type II toxin-antitoxin system HigB family toxin [Testudinibacter]TNG93983.1 type II toxin-antitoxin system HigB family toxin [Pasteurellaceae bacterium UScroc12]TNG94693.1 type II toxin-antitoxin system HigB family toxin [Pasteurellaceae bacterium USgator41]TNG98920.1 type II toxin-antitoxin system HigB family toxin [Pasteurellaceae bacterium UScroc31]TNH01219.1 type II toxin-antitoxin system HigB family toxin [Pasteurellaceae bacterium USgator11]TNH03523.1 type II toxin-anti